MFKAVFAPKSRWTCLPDRQMSDEVCWIQCESNTGYKVHFGPPSGESQFFTGQDFIEQTHGVDNTYVKVFLEVKNLILKGGEVPFMVEIADSEDHRAVRRTYYTYFWEDSPRTGVFYENVDYNKRLQLWDQITGGRSLLLKPSDQNANLYWQIPDYLAQSPLWVRYRLDDCTYSDERVWIKPNVDSAFKVFSMQLPT